MNIKEKISDILYAENEDTELEFHSERVDEIIQLFLEMVGEETNNYNNHKENCESCGVLEGSLCHDGCEAMAERYMNRSINELRKRIEES